MATVDWDGAKNCLVDLATKQIRLFLAEKEPLDQICAFGLSLQNSDGYANLAADTIEFRERKYKEYCSTWKPISRTEWSARMGNWKYKGGIIRQEPNLDREWGPFAAQIAAANEDLFYEEDDDSEVETGPASVMSRLAITDQVESKPSRVDRSPKIVQSVSGSTTIVLPSRESVVRARSPTYSRVPRSDASRSRGSMPALSSVI